MNRDKDQLKDDPFIWHRVIRHSSRATDKTDYCSVEQYDGPGFSSSFKDNESLRIINWTLGVGLSLYDQKFTSLFDLVPPPTKPRPVEVRG